MLIVVYEKQEFILKKTLYMYFVIKKKTFNSITYMVFYHTAYSETENVFFKSEKGIYIWQKQWHFVSSDLKFQKKEKEKKIQVGDKKMIIREIIKWISLTQLVRYQKSKIKFLSCK